MAPPQWRTFQLYAHGFSYRLGKRPRGRHAWEIHRAGKAVEAGEGFASAFAARKAVLTRLTALIKDERGAA